MNVIPAEAGIQCYADMLVSRSLDSCLRRNDDLPSHHGFDSAISSTDANDEVFIGIVFAQLTLI